MLGLVLGAIVSPGLLGAMVVGSLVFGTVGVGVPPWAVNTTRSTLFNWLSVVEKYSVLSAA